MIRTCLVIAMLLLASSPSSAAPASGKEGRGEVCLSDFLSSDGDWQARTFDGVAIDAGAFTPVEALFVRKGHVHAKAWHSEPTSARIKADGSDVLLKVFYPDPLFATSNASKRLTPYANARHRLVMRGECKAPGSFTVEIGPQGNTHSVGFVRVATSRVEFQEPARWDFDGWTK